MPPVVVERTGGPEVLQVVGWPAPGPGGRVVIDVAASGVNVVDKLLRRANDVLGALAEGRLDLRVCGRYPLAEAARGHEDLEA